MVYETVKTEKINNLMKVIYKCQKGTHNYQQWTSEEYEKIEAAMKELDQLVQKLHDRCDFLTCLESCGVDNWGGYGDAQEMFDEAEPE